jgi:hypothetical protein
MPPARYLLRRQEERELPSSTPSSKSPQPAASAWPWCSRGCLASPSSCLPVSPRCLALVLTAAVWWLYFGSEGHDSEVLQEHVPAQRRPRTAIYSFGYAYFVIVSASPSPRSGWRRRSIPSITHPRPARRAPACRHLPIPGRSRRLSPDAVRHLTARPALGGARRRLGLRGGAYARKVRPCYTSLEDMPPTPYQAMAGAVSVLLLRGRSWCLARGGHVQQDHGVVVSGTGLGDVDAQALTGRTFQLHALKA